MRKIIKKLTLRLASAKESRRKPNHPFVHPYPDKKPRFIPLGEVKLETKQEPKK